MSGRFRDEASRWGTLLTSADDDDLRVRPTPTEWSPLEYAVHVRDVLAVFSERTMRALAEDEPELEWWDHEAAIEDGWANESDVTAVADDLVRNAANLEDVLDRVPPEGWARGATRRGSERFTVELLARFALHEMVHHRVDAKRALSAS